MVLVMSAISVSTPFAAFSALVAAAFACSAYADASLILEFIVLTKPVYQSESGLIIPLPLKEDIMFNFPFGLVIHV